MLNKYLWVCLMYMLFLIGYIQKVWQVAFTNVCCITVVLFLWFLSNSIKVSMIKIFQVSLKPQNFSQWTKYFGNPLCFWSLWFAMCWVQTGHSQWSECIWFVCCQITEDDCQLISWCYTPDFHICSAWTWNDVKGCRHQQCMYPVALLEHCTDMHFAMTDSFWLILLLSLTLLSYCYPHMPIGKVWIYRLLFVSLFIFCNFVYVCLYGGRFNRGG